MTATGHTPAATRRHAPLRHFVQHYLEMVLAMIIGMIVLGPVWNFVLDRIGLADLFARPDLGALLMATDMTIAMAAWMRYRGHGWPATLEMSAAMYLPFIVLFVPLWTGLISGHVVMMAGHLLMLPAMALAMLLRLKEYTGGHGSHA